MNKQAVLDDCRRYWNPAKTDFWVAAGTDLVIDRREGYALYDASGKRLIDLHLNGGTFNLGHRHPEVVQALIDGTDHFDIGNHHFPSIARARLARELAECTPGDLQYVLFGAGGGEAIDLALKTARHATGRRKIVSIIKGYHGHTGLAVQTGDPRFSDIFLSQDLQGDFVKVLFNDIDAMATALAGGDAAAVIMETIPATYGFPMPAEGYLEETCALCRKHGSLYIADEVQTGLMRTGRMWGIEHHGFDPDILVTGKGLSGGIYPMSAAVVSARCAGWLHEDGFAHMSTFGGAELGCVVASKVLEITQRTETRENVAMLIDRFTAGLDKLRQRHADYFVGIRQRGLVMGLEFDHPEGAMHVSRQLYDKGVWAIFSTLDPRILQFKPGLLVDATLCDEILETLDAAIEETRNAQK
ncbi:MAG: aminotransferase class III-fold pyridoxal phosphate-dependent enzyme [Planctomycetota bacterium]|nr:aminotransferase class III-fold pyridoxal phosphate-dependent enzyme [Planctomycetota bacterium]